MIVKRILTRNHNQKTFVGKTITLIILVSCLFIFPIAPAHPNTFPLVRNLTMMVSEPEITHLSASDIETSVDKLDSRITVLIHFKPTASAEERQTYITNVQGIPLLWIDPLNVAKVSIPSSVKNSMDRQEVSASSIDVIDLIEQDGMVYSTSLSEQSKLEAMQYSYSTTHSRYMDRSTMKQQTEFITLLIHFKDSTNEEERNSYISNLDGELLLWIDALNIAQVRVPSSIVQHLDDIPVGGANDAVKLFELDEPVYNVVTNDPALGNHDLTYTPELLNLSEAWNQTTGNPNTVIAVLDTGIAVEHPEFRNKLLDGFDFFNNDNNPDDDNGHGSHVAGIAAAAINNGIGSAGMCGGCSLLPVKVLSEHSIGTWSSVSAGIVYAVDNDADVIVLSLGSTLGSKIVEDALKYAFDHDVLVIAAVGNANSSRAFYPAAYEGVIGVSATDRNNKRWALSNFGDYVDISAPGHNIYSTYNDLENLHKGHVTMSGTSMAAPHVGGLVGLIKSQDPTRDSAEITEILFHTATNLGKPGKDALFGYGLINPVAALSTDLDGTRSRDHDNDIWYLPMLVQ